MSERSPNGIGPQNYERTRYEALLDVRYGACFNRLNERFYRHLRSILGFTQALLGAGAVYTWIAQLPALAAAAAVLTTLAGIIDYIVSPAERAASFNQLYRRYMGLDERAAQLTLEQIDAELARLRADSHAYAVASLDLEAYNANLRAHGRPEYVRPLSFGQRVAAFLA